MRGTCMAEFSNAGSKIVASASYVIHHAVNKYSMYYTNMSIEYLQYYDS